MEQPSSIILRDGPRATNVAGSNQTASPWLESWRKASGLALSRGTIFLPLIAVALWALTHPYRGIAGDASIYIGRALADLDPNGLGRDLLFANDGQSRFSLYPWLVKQAVTAWGTDGAALALSFAAEAMWIVALAVLARRFLAWQHVWIVVAFVAVLPVNYGAPQRFGFSELFAVPRPMAEALTLLALAAFLGRKTLLAFAVLLAATLIHPLAALAGWVTLGLALALEDRRWWLAGGLAALALALGTSLGLPPFDRLVEAMAPDVKALAASRSPLLFPTQWPREFLGPIIAQMATIGIAASLYEGRWRRLLLASTFVGVSGIAVQALFGDILSSLLVIQVQCWRMAWLTAAIGSFALALCALELWKRGPLGRVVLALLTVIWIASNDPAAAAVLAVVTLIIHFTKDRFAWPVTTFSVKAIWAIACLVALFVNVKCFIGYGEFLAGIPAEADQGFDYFWSVRYSAFPIGALILALMLPRKNSRLLWAGRCITAVALIAAAVHFWDDRSAFQRMVDRQERPPALLQAIVGRPGEVLWVGGLGEAWYLTGRPQWASRQQAVASVFSRELALAWRDRMTFLRDEGLADRNVLNSVTIPSAADLPQLSEAGLAHLCERTDAPAVVIAPVETGAKPFAGWPATVWHLPQPIYKITDEGETYAWHKFEDFLVLPCAAR
jgi:hypothetical protein